MLHSNIALYPVQTSSWPTKNIWNLYHFVTQVKNEFQLNFGDQKNFDLTFLEIAQNTTY